MENSRPTSGKLGLNTAQPQSGVYPLVFLVAVGILLLSFVPIPKMNLPDLSNNFRWRQDLISAYSQLRLGLGDRVFYHVLVGQKGWLYYTADGSMAEYQKTNGMKRKDLATLAGELDALNADLQREGKTFLLVIAPNKSSIYPQYMPAELPIIGQTSQLDQLLEYMSEHGSMHIVDLRSMLIEQSATSQVYYRTDTHWNDLGAYYASRDILNALAEKYPALAAYPLTDYRRVKRPDQTWDLANIMGMPQLQEETWILTAKRTQLKGNGRIQKNQRLPDGTSIRRISSQNATLPRLVIYHDSFYLPIEKFIEPRFGSVTALPYTLQPGVWSTRWIQKETPDIVVIEIAERSLDHLRELLESDPQGR